MSIWFFFSMISLVFATQHQGITHSQQYQIHYDVEIEHDFYQLTTSDVILLASDQHLVFDSKEKLFIGQIIVSNENQFVGQIRTINGTQYTADPYQDSLIKNGKIQVTPNSGPKVPFCFGFNADSSCQHPLQTIVLFDNEILKADCDNCFSAVGGDLFLDLEFSNFHLKSLSFGLKELHLRGGVGVTIDGRDQWSYVYDKTYAILNKVKIVSFSIGFLTFDLYLDLPVEVDFRAEASVHGQVKYGVDVDLNLGDLYLKYQSSRWQIVKSTPITNTHPYFSSLATVDGHASWAIRPLVSLYSPNIFHLNLHFNPSTTMTLSGSLERHEVCLDGSYQANIIFNGDLLKEKIKDITIYDSGIHQVIKQCFHV